MRYNRARVMTTAHAEYRLMRGTPGWDFARCLRLAWAVEKRRLTGREYYNPESNNGLDRRDADYGASRAA